MLIWHPAWSIRIFNITTKLYYKQKHVPLKFEYVSPQSPKSTHCSHSINIHSELDEAILKIWSQVHAYFFAGIMSIVGRTSSWFWSLKIWCSILFPLILSKHQAPCLRHFGIRPWHDISSYWSTEFHVVHLHSLLHLLFIFIHWRTNKTLNSEKRVSTHAEFLNKGLSKWGGGYRTDFKTENNDKDL